MIVSPLWKSPLQCQTLLSLASSVHIFSETARQRNEASESEFLISFAATGIFWKLKCCLHNNWCIFRQISSKADPILTATVHIQAYVCWSQRMWLNFWMFLHILTRSFNKETLALFHVVASLSEKRSEYCQIFERFFSSSSKLRWGLGFQINLIKLLIPAHGTELEQGQAQEGFTPGN